MALPPEEELDRDLRLRRALFTAMNEYLKAPCGAQKADARRRYMGILREFTARVLGSEPLD
jgi:hypothetical protein